MNVQADWSAAAAALRQARPVQDLRPGLRRAAQTLGNQIRAAGAAAAPRRGGLAARVATAQVQIREQASTGQVRVEVDLAADGVSLANLERGRIFHPVFGRPRSTVAQDVASGAFSRAMSEHTDLVTQAVSESVERTLEQIARSTS